MKKFITLTIVGMMALSMVACKGESAIEEPASIESSSEESSMEESVSEEVSSEESSMEESVSEETSK
ncbi:hypothetical protein [[Clostridium] colinum]|uniref:hypothetical protein n=1 Tax=[Clostridium] colinum TaxID=36835 RepID=UPI00202468F5|nr:hypothetical protein [[Clostridium] colinum]